VVCFAVPPLTLLRTGAGSAVAPAVLSGLRRAGARVVAADMNADAVGFALADAAVRIPPASSADLVPALLAACRTERVDVLFPDVDEEFLPIARARAEFERAGVRVLLSGVDTLDRCIDKLRFADEMRRLALPAPPTWSAADAADARWPLFAKPRRGRGSAHARPVRDPGALAGALDTMPDPVVQPLLPGPELSIDTLSTLDGRFLYASIRERLATRAGISVRGRTVSWPRLEVLAGRVVEAMGVAGPACLQCLLDDAGQPWFTDCNPRLGGGVVLSVEAGAPILADLLRLIRGEPPLGKAAYRAGLVMERDGEPHLRDRFVDPLERVSAVTFDLDDTLYDREAHLGGARAAVAAEVAGATGLPQDALESALTSTWLRLGSDHPGIFDTWIAQLGLGVDLVPRCVEAFHSAVPEVLLPAPGVVEALAALRGRGVRCAIVTEGRDATQRAKARALGLLDRVDAFVCGPAKPDAAGLHDAAARLDVPVARLLHVGDHPRNDVVMAHRAGALSARVLRGEFAARRPDPEASPDLTCADVPAVVDRVLGVVGR
jgi:carbamoyl-phosphate synthase large subunit